jgi:hypothetical protein
MIQRDHEPGTPHNVRSPRRLRRYQAAAGSCAITFRITNFRILPVTVIGQVSTNRTWRGSLKCVVWRRKKPRMPSSVAVTPGFSLIQGAELERFAQTDNRHAAGDAGDTVRDPAAGCILAVAAMYSCRKPP